MRTGLAELRIQCALIYKYVMYDIKQSVNPVLLCLIY
jgi:hypothetical protein